MGFTFRTDIIKTWTGWQRGQEKQHLVTKLQCDDERGRRDEGIHNKWLPKEKSSFQQSFIIWRCILSQDWWEMVLNIATITAQPDIAIFNTLLISSLESGFGEIEIVVRMLPQSKDCIEIKRKRKKRRACLNLADEECCFSWVKSMSHQIQVLWSRNA